MAKPYDAAATKRLIELHPADWVTLRGLPIGPVSLVDADLSTVSASADRLIRVDTPTPYLLHNELESGKDTGDTPERLLRYNVNASFKTGLPVVSSVFLLRRESNRSAITGTLTKPHPDGTPYLTFRYHVVRVWELNIETLLNGGLGTLPLAPIAQVAQADLPALIRRMEARVEAAAASETEAADLWTATYVLLGLSYNKAFNAQLLQGVRRMKESVTYQAILEEGCTAGRTEGRTEGRIEEARRILLRQGTLRLGKAPAALQMRVQEETNADTLETLLDRILQVETWNELFDGNAS